MHTVSKGVEALSKEEHGLFFDAVQRLGLSNEVKEAAVALYVDFKGRPVGEYNSERKNLNIFLVASVSLAAKITGDLRTDREFESKMFVRREKLADAEERILRSFSVQDSPIPLSDFVMQLTKRQIQTMAEGFADREMIDIDEKEQLLKLAYDYLDLAIKNGLGPKMSYRGRASGVILRAIKDLGLEIPDADIARSAGFDKRTMAVNANLIGGLLKDSETPERNAG